MKAPSISEVLDACHVGPNHYEWPQAGSGERIEQITLLRTLQRAFDASDRNWPFKVMRLAVTPQPVLAAADALQPGDIWWHAGGGRLYVTGESHQFGPEYLQCYWAMGGNPNAPGTIWHCRNIQHLRLLNRTYHAAHGSNRSLETND